MATTIAAADLAEIVSYINTQFDDIDEIIPDGVVLADVVAVVAPTVLDEVNMRLGKSYGAASGTLDDQILTLVEWGTICQILSTGYRRLQADEKEWVNDWCDRYLRTLEALASGEGALDDGEAVTLTICTACETRKLTTRDDMYDDEGDEISSLDDDF